MKQQAQNSRQRSKPLHGMRFIDWATNMLRYASAAFIFLIPILFVYINKIQKGYYVDEKFHVPQTIKYCAGNITEWDSKITTFPGLYIVTALYLGPLELCTTIFMRFVNVILTLGNLGLCLTLVSTICQERINRDPQVKYLNVYLSAWNIAFFPPLFFYFCFYYTDVLSTTMVLAMLLSHVKKNYKMTALMGAFAIIARQTNVVWLAYLAIENSLTFVEEYTKRPELTRSLNISRIIKIIYAILSAKARIGLSAFGDFVGPLCKLILPHVIVLLVFFIFVIYNGGIVVGDKSAHQPTIHLAQLLYFSVFVFIFAWPYILPHFRNFVQFLYKHILLSSILLGSITLIVHFNTLVHPYILADNRHYSFYIWKNFMNRDPAYKFIPVPFYALFIYSIVKTLSSMRLLSLAAYLLCTSFVLIPQLLLEPRYFIVPYIIFRLKQSNIKNWQIVCETLTTMFVILAQFALFSFKSFSWSDEEHPQRIGW
ncbi:hypothetical protein TKK_0001778 [Trichogramma kaykai]|uniref:Dol-P-Glc:Glc(2)Man(9)GlcNAc(2)-PP-Dol alpha-1,2-glucosyltransferase n=1 Tax=Trichogramma kaykai TaxID=54128 RepID=A0ABD2XFA6_9HYME